MSNQYLDRFFEEKEIPFQLFNIDHNGQTHFVENSFIIEVIKNATITEKETISNTLRQIDFHNGDVNHYLQHLATAYIKHNYSN